MEGDIFVGGVVSLTSIDYPGYLASVIFLQGCPWRCRYCHNRHLQTISPTESLPWEDVLNLLKTRRNFVDAVVFSGGEPLFQKSLRKAILNVKEMGFKIGLHTGGGYPDRLQQLLDIIDWVGFDIKQDFEKYPTITNIENSGAKALESLKILIDSNISFEARMTVDETIQIPDIIAVMNRIAALGVKNAVLQKCRDKGGHIIEHPIFSDQQTLDNLTKKFENFLVRE